MSIKNKLRASLNLHDLGVCILTGEDALDAFDADQHAQFAEILRKQNLEAFARLNELLRWLKREHDNPMREF